jgi:TolB-like protein
MHTALIARDPEPMVIRRRLPNQLIALVLSVAIAGCQWAARPVGTPTPAVLAADSAVRDAVFRERDIDASTFPERVVAVAPFRIESDDSSLAVLGFGLADFLMTDLARSREIQLVDRLRLDALIRELRLANSSLSSNDSAVRFGKLAGARRVILGSVVTLGGSRARLDGRIGNVATGAIQATQPSETSLEAILDAEKELAFAVFDQLGVVLSPAERARIEQRPTRSVAALLAYSRGVRAEAMLNYSEARAAFQEAVRIDPQFDAANSRLEDVGGMPDAPSSISPVSRAGDIAIEAVNVPALPAIATAADPAFRQRLVATIIILINLP